VKVLKLLLLGCLISAGCSDDFVVHELDAGVHGETHHHEHRTEYTFAESRYGSYRPVPLTHNEEQPIAALGERLFHDPQLSSDKTVACASCHSIQHGGDDGLSKSFGVKQAQGDMNAPTVLNSALNMRQFWDGRALSLEERIEGPITNPVEMHSNWPLIVERLSADQSYVDAFKQAFGTAVTQQNVIEAIASYERTLLTPKSPFDQFIAGDKRALSESQYRGFVAFNDLGCVTCHQGVNLGGNLYQKIGLINDFYTDDSAQNVSNQGLYNLTGDEQDRFVFRVPTLRNVTQTAPYFHDGSSPDLSDAVTKMAFYQLGLSLDTAQVSDIVSFLSALSAPPLTIADRGVHEHGSGHDDHHSDPMPHTPEDTDRHDEEVPESQDAHDHEHHDVHVKHAEVDPITTTRKLVTYHQESNS